MKLGPATTLDKRQKTIIKYLTMTSCQKIVTSLSFFGFMANLEQSRTRIPDAKSVIVTFYLTKSENRTKKSPTQLSFSLYIALSKSTAIT